MQKLSFSASLIYSFIKANPACTFGQIKEASGFNALQLNLVLDELLAKEVIEVGLDDISDLSSSEVYYPTLLLVD